MNSWAPLSLDVGERRFRELDSNKSVQRTLLSPPGIQMSSSVKLKNITSLSWTSALKFPVKQTQPYCWNLFFFSKRNVNVHDPLYKINQRAPLGCLVESFRCIPNGMRAIFNWENATTRWLNLKTKGCINIERWCCCSHLLTITTNTEHHPFISWCKRDVPLAPVSGSERIRQSASILTLQSGPTRSVRHVPIMCSLSRVRRPEAGPCLSFSSHLRPPRRSPTVGRPWRTAACRTEKEGACVHVWSFTCRLILNLWLIRWNGFCLGRRVSAWAPASSPPTAHLLFREATFLFWAGSNWIHRVRASAH